MMTVTRRMRASTASGKEKRKEKRGGNSRVKEGERKGRKEEKGKWKGGGARALLVYYLTLN
jgi:hypothetical protein